MYEVQSFAWVLQNSGETVSASFYSDGVLADPGVVTVDVASTTDASFIVAASTSGTGAAARTLTLTPTQTADLDTLTATWHTTLDGVAMDFTTQIEIVGAHLFTVNEARTFDKAQLTSVSKYPAATIAEARARIADAFGAICGVQFVPRYRRQVIDGSRDPNPYDWLRDPLTLMPVGREIELPDTKIIRLRTVETRTAGSATWTTYGADDFADVILTPEATIFREARGAWPIGRQNIRVGYECGYQQPPQDIKRAALILLVDQLVAKDLTDRALSQTTDLGTFRIATAGERGSYFGLPLVDSVLDLYARQRVPVVG